MNNKSFKGHLFRWLFFKVVWPHIPLLWKCDLAVYHIKWMKYKRHFKDNFFGPLKVIVVTVDKDWAVVKGRHTETLVRDITYRYKRERLPFAFRKKYVGTQCTDETAFPLNRLGHDKVANLNDTIHEHNVRVAAANERNANHKTMRESIVNHQFQEYNHEH